MEKPKKPENNSEDKELPEHDSTKTKICGIIMPIAPSTNYPGDHWKDVLNILVETLSETEFKPKLVSDDVAIGLIHERIVTNIYHNEMVVCDVSSKNPNVMFELGMRLAFDKPTIIIKDELTDYSFDTGGIEHLSYPASLRFNTIVQFKQELKKRLIATYEKSQTQKGYSPFLQSFGRTIVPASITTQEIPEGKYILEKLEILSSEVRRLRNSAKYNDLPSSNFKLNISDSATRDIVFSEFDRYAKLYGTDQLLENGSEKKLVDYISRRGFNVEEIIIHDLLIEYVNKRSLK